MSGTNSRFVRYLPYLAIFWFMCKLGEAYRLADGGSFLAKLAGSVSELSGIITRPLPSFVPADLSVGLLGTVVVYLFVMYRIKKAKKWRPDQEHGSARWGGAKDIAPFMEKNPEDNIILTQTEGLTMNPRPPNPKYARNKNMSNIGRMNRFIELVSTTPTKDAEGFVTAGDTVLANVRAYFEPKNATEKWKSNAAFSEASALFRFRSIPGVAVDPTIYIICAGDRYRIISAEDVRGRGMYIEALAAKVEGSVY